MTQDVETRPSEDGYQPIILRTSRGKVECRYYGVPNAQLGAIWVGGVGGGWDTPAQGLYPRLCKELKEASIASLRVRYRYPTILEEAVHDVLAGIAYLEQEGIESVALTGHSFGGAVVIQAAAASETVRTIVTLATQSYGADSAARLGPRCSTLVIHGTKDEVLPPFCSEYVHQIAREPKQLILYPGARHGLDEVAEELYGVVRKWIVTELGKASS
jgi:dienelactone hydrolase